LPESASTRHFFDSERFGQFKPGARYYNIGRGPTTDQEALRTALTSGHLAAAYLDVTDPEPLPPDHPLWSLPNCYITPHTGGGHVTEPIRTVQHFIDNLRLYERGEPLVDRVW
jgi:phosphoglycerate dehydrogenase-like enzyme